MLLFLVMVTISTFLYFSVSMPGAILNLVLLNSTCFFCFINGENKLQVHGWNRSSKEHKSIILAETSLSLQIAGEKNGLQQSYLKSISYIHAWVFTYFSVTRK